VTKKEIVKTICDWANSQKPPLLKGNLTQLATKEIVQQTFEAIIETLCRDGRIELRNFGVFEVKSRKKRKARNPRTGEKVEVEAKNVVTFQPGKEMEERVRQLAKPAEPKKKARKGKKPAEAEAVPSANGAPSEVVEVEPLAALAAATVAAPTPAEAVTSDAPAAT
jgi:nucleoid DNA-binding protein